MKRTCGVLLPVASLPSRYGIGCFSTEAYRFVDFLEVCLAVINHFLKLCIHIVTHSTYLRFLTIEVSNFVDVVTDVTELVIMHACE